MEVLSTRERDGSGYSNAAKISIPLQDIGSNPVYVICWVEQLVDDPTNGFANITLANGGQIKLEVEPTSLPKTPGTSKASVTSREILESMLPKVIARLVVRVDFGIFADTAAMWVNPSNLANLGPADVSITEPGANYSFNPS